MRTRILFIVSLVSFFVCLSVYGEANSACQNSNGRYQLMQGTYTSTDLRKGEKATRTDIFLLDSCTGKVKRYVTRVEENGKYVETWDQAGAEQKSGE